MRLADHLLTLPRGAQLRIARAVGVTPVAVSQWAAGAKQVPVGRCALVERATGGHVSVDELRPDIPWARLPDPAWPHPQGRPLPDFAAAEHKVREAA